MLKLKDKIEKKINTIADLKLDILFEEITFEKIQNQILDIYHNDLYKNKDRKIKSGRYTIYLPIVDTKGKNWYETIYIDAESVSLLDFIYDICQQLDSKTKNTTDWHIFLEGFKKISENEYEAILGS